MAIFWSLDSFFPLTFAGLSVFFGFLWLRQSGVTFTRPERPAYQSQRQEYKTRFTPPPAASVTPSAVTDPAQKIKSAVRTVLFISVGIVVTLFFIGLFSDNPETPSTEESPVESTETSVAPTPAQALSAKGNEAYNREEYDSAIIYYGKAATLDPNDKSIWYNMGGAYCLKKDYLRSNTQLRKSLKIDRNYNDALWLIGWNYYTLNYNDSALVYLQRADRNGFSHPDFYSLLGEVYARMDNSSMAIAKYKQCLALDSSRVAIYDALAQLDPVNATRYQRMSNKYR